MTVREGKVLLKECFEGCGITEPLDKILYKYGNVKKAGNYQHDEITTHIEPGDIKPGMRYVIKCFIHFEIYVAWHVDVGRGNCKYINYRRDLVNLEVDESFSFQEKQIAKNVTAYYFKGEEGIKQFIEKVYKAG